MSLKKELRLYFFGYIVGVIEIDNHGSFDLLLKAANIYIFSVNQNQNVIKKKNTFRNFKY